MASTNPYFNIGNDVRLTFIGPYGQVNFSHVVQFNSKPITKKVDVAPLNRSPIMRYLPGGWNFTIQIDRANLNADAIQALMDLNFWNSGQVPQSTLYQYIRELDGSTTTIQFQEVAFELQDAGTWHQEQSVKQVIEGFASQRVQV